MRNSSMQNHPNVSIYIITYLNTAERGEVLKKTCEWVLQQNYPNFEVVVSDNGSPYSVVDALSSIQDSRLKVCLNKENVGFTGNMNRCLEHCSYDIIKPLCDDDLIHPDFLLATVPLVDDDTLVVAAVENFMFGTQPAGIDQPLSKPLETEMRNAGYGADIWTLPYSNSCIPSAILFTRNLFRELGGYESGTRLSDWDFFVEACLYKRVIHVMRTLCHVGVWDEAETVIKLREEPYFFAREGLYTSFRVLRSGNLSNRERTMLMLRLWRKFAMDSLVPFKHPFSKVHHIGYAGFTRRFFQLLCAKKNCFQQSITSGRGVVPES